jgi:tetratricopeptide (TPR) repeat protein
MKRESIVFALSGTFFGLIVGWIIGSQRPAAPVSPVAAAAAQTAPSASGGPSAPAPKPLDTVRAADLERRATAEPRSAALRAELANVYFDADRHDLAIPWYEASLKIDAANIDVSTDLAVSYYYTNQIDKALAQLDRSLAIDPRHLKTLLNQGIVRAWGKQDLAGAAESWQRVVTIAPSSEEARRATQGLEAIRSSHPDLAGARGAGGGGKSPQPPQE